MLTWKAKYKDGEELPQFNEDGSENAYKDIDRNRLVRFDLYNGSKIVHALYLNKDQRLIFRRRNFITLSSEQKEERHLIYLVGWQMRVEMVNRENDNWGGIIYKNISAINYIYEDGSIALDGDRSDIKYLEEEDI